MKTDDRISPLKLLMVEDNPGDARLIEEMLKDAWQGDFTIRVFDRLAAGQNALLSDPADVVFLDLNLPDSRGVETLTQIRAQDTQAVIIILTSVDDEETAIESLRKGAQDYLIKDKVTAEILRRSVRYSIERKRIEQALIKREKELEVKTCDLEEANVALKVLLKKIDKDKTNLEEHLVLNAKELVEPFLNKLKRSGLNREQRDTVDIIEFNINGITSPLLKGLSVNFRALTPTEIQIANLVRFGKSTKEIAQSLNLSARTIEAHRNNIRKKLKITNKKVNLRTYLESHPDNS